MVYRAGVLNKVKPNTRVVGPAAPLISREGDTADARGEPDKIGVTATAKIY